MDRAFTGADAAPMDETAARTFLLRVGKNIRLYRVERDMSQERLALDAGMQRSALSRLERGLVDPKATTLARVAGALRVDVRDLLAPRGERQ